jgi:hypothetical protein
MLGVMVGPTVEGAAAAARAIVPDRAAPAECMPVSGAGVNQATDFLTPAGAFLTPRG